MAQAASDVLAQSKGPRQQLVTPGQLKSHLTLLHSFYVLRLSVEGSDTVEVDPRIPDWAIELDKDVRWSWFVGLAVERFQRWCQSLSDSTLPKDSNLEKHLPPIDVLMVWHSYLLNPGWYTEDCQRLPILSGLQKLDELNSVHGSALSVAMDAHTRPPSTDRVVHWVSCTGTSFDLFDALESEELIEKSIECPFCLTQISHPYITPEGTGYLQKKFSIACTSSTCGHIIDKGSLSAYKLIKDLVRPSSEPDFFLAGTLYTPTAIKDVTQARNVRAGVYRLHFMKKQGAEQTSTERRAFERKIWETVHYSAERLRALVLLSIGPRKKLSGRIMSAYTHDRPFSVELVGAVLRQGSFTKKMVDLRWTEPTFFRSDVDGVVLNHAIARYHAFLDLMWSSPKSFFVPTLDIDLVWHSHQLRHEDYNRDCKKYVGRYIDHDDKVEEGKLATSFDLTCRTWQSRYGMPYMHCGCPLPGDTIGQKLSRLVHLHSQQPAFLTPPNNPDALAGTHPSDHNAVFALHRKGQSDLDRKAREAKFIKRRQRDAGLARGSQLPVHHHEIAFLTPVPMFIASAVCVSWGGGVDGKSVGCAVGAGGCSSSGVGPCAGGAETGRGGCGNVAACTGGGGGDSGGGDSGGGAGDSGGGGGDSGGGGGCGGGGCGGGGGGGCGGGS